MRLGDRVATDQQLQALQVTVESLKEVEQQQQLLVMEKVSDVQRAAVDEAGKLMAVMDLK